MSMICRSRPSLTMKWSSRCPRLGYVARILPNTRQVWRISLGHEGCGVISAVGRNVPSERLGERVAIEPNPLRKMRGLSRAEHLGAPIAGWLGAMFRVCCGRKVAVPVAFARRIPDWFSHPQGACVEPLAVAMSAVRRARVNSGERCLVIGAGSQRLLVSMVLKANGAVPVLTDVHRGRLALAEELGMEVLQQ